MTAKEQAALRRAAHGLSADQRHYVANVLYSWWRNGSPTGPASGTSYSRLERAGAKIDEGLKIYPELIRETSARVRARIERFRQWRGTPRLVLMPGIPYFCVIIRKYDNWGVFQGEGTPPPVYRPYSTYKTDWIRYLSQQKTWSENSFGIAKGLVHDAGVTKDRLPEWLLDAVRNWERIKKTKALVPSKSEIQRYRRKCGLVRRSTMPSMPSSP